MTEYKANSHRSKEEQSEKKKVEQVAKAKTKKKSSGKKLIEGFISEDISSVKDYIINDVLLPAAKKAIADVVTNGIDMVLYGEVRNKNRRSSKVSYSKYYDDRDRDKRTTRHSTSYSYDEIILDTRADAEEVLDQMDNLLEAYEIVSVADLYDLVGITGRYTDNKYGWTNLRSASVQRVRDGYLLKLPRAKAID